MMKTNKKETHKTAIWSSCIIAIIILFAGFAWSSKNSMSIFSADTPDKVSIDEPENIPEEYLSSMNTTSPIKSVETFKDEIEELSLESEIILGSNMDDIEEEAHAFPTSITKIEDAPIEKEEIDHSAEDKVFFLVENMPEFPGGESGLMCFIAKAIKYPTVAKEKGVEGRITCSFVVNTDGSIVDASVIRGIDSSLDKEALRVINSMPKWRPGRQNGKVVKVKYTIPINFRLQNYY